MTYLTTPELAKHVRGLLKEAFPGTKFSVRSKSYAGGSAIDVSWMDGPPTSAVDAIVKPLEGATFDGMQDLKEYRDVEVNGKQVLTDWIMTSREVSSGWRDELVAELEELCDEKVPYVGDRPSWDATLNAFVDLEGRPHRTADSEPGEYVSDLLHRMAAKRAVP